MISIPDLSQIQAVVFDMDGTLVDSEGHYCHAYIHTMETFGGSLTPEDYYQRFAEQTDEAIDRLLHAELEGRVDQPTIRRTWAEEYHRLRQAGGVPQLPGAADLLDHFAARGLPMAVARSSSRWRGWAVRNRSRGTSWEESMRCSRVAREASGSRLRP